MRARCTNPRAADFEHYGGRGISVCKEWRFSFEAFYADLGQRPERHSLDRVDVNGNYEPKNCRWADDKQQRKNRRPPQPVKRRRFIEQAELSSPPLDDPPF
jgi:hypothetical protein